MTQIWKVSWNAKLYNYEKLINDYLNNKHSGIIYQSKGKAHMINLPQINDIVNISCKKQHILTCKIITGFINNGIEEQNDSYNLTNLLNNRNHADNNIYLTMQIINVVDRQKRPLLKGCQRTWCKYKSN